MIHAVYQLRHHLETSGATGLFTKCKEELALLDLFHKSYHPNDLLNILDGYREAALMTEGVELYIEPNICLRGVRGYDHLVDIGANLVFLKEYLDVFAVWSRASYLICSGELFMNTKYLW